MRKKKTWHNIPFELSRELIVEYVPNPKIPRFADWVYDGGAKIFDEQTSQSLKLGKEVEASIVRLLGGNLIEELWGKESPRKNRL